MTMFYAESLDIIGADVEAILSYTEKKIDREVEDC